MSVDNVDGQMMADYLVGCELAWLNASSQKVGYPMHL